MAYKVSEMVDRTIDGWLVHMGWRFEVLISDEWTCTSCSWIHFRSWKGQIPLKWVCFWFNYPIKKQWNHEEMHSRWPYFFHILCITFVNSSAVSSNSALDRAFLWTRLKHKLCQLVHQTSSSPSARHGNDKPKCCQDLQILSETTIPCSILSWLHD